MTIYIFHFYLFLQRNHPNTLPKLKKWRPFLIRYRRKWKRKCYI